ncbi:MAG: hypothetical protein OXC81_03190 [Betaproteobacteria bacterium]|nr:hypothetical protein [Betaproteobacteria bacterium]
MSDLMNAITQPFTTAGSEQQADLGALAETLDVTNPEQVNEYTRQWNKYSAELMVEASTLKRLEKLLETLISKM